MSVGIPEKNEIIAWRKLCQSIMMMDIGPLYRPLRDHEKVGVPARTTGVVRSGGFLWKLFPYRFGDEGHEGMKKLQRDLQDLAKGRRAALPRGGIFSFKYRLRLLEYLRREPVPHEVVDSISGEIEPENVDVFGNGLRYILRFRNQCPVRLEQFHLPARFTL